MSDDISPTLLCETFLRLVKTIGQLRDPISGCPWDVQQTHSSLRRFMIEEAYEAAEAMSETNMVELASELGDVLLQVILNAQIAQESGQFNIVNVMQVLDDKMRRRHPHVFAGKQGVHDKEAVHKQWLEIKAAEKDNNKSKSIPVGVFAGDVAVHPAMRQAFTIGKTSATIDFDWKSAHDTWTVVLNEIEELQQALNQETEHQNVAHVEEEWGDVMFSLIQFARHRGFDPEVALLDANKKFLRRFGSIESLAAERGLDVRSMGLDGLDQLWNEVKVLEQSSKKKK